MYIGRIGTAAHPDDGCYVLLKEVVDNAIDEYIMGHGKEVQINIEGNRWRCAISAAASRWARSWTAFPRSTPARNTTTRFSVQRRPQRRRHQGRQRAVEKFLVRSHRDGEFAEASFKIGKLKKEDSGKTKEPNGTLIEFEPDGRFSRNSEFRWNTSSAGCGITAI
jgi:topoisomerase-4 subunit B